MLVVRVFVGLGILCSGSAQAVYRRFTNFDRFTALEIGT